MSINPNLFPVIPPRSNTFGRPFWTVAIPAYNRPEMLANCLRSVLMQDPGADQMQIVVVDDCSPTPLAPIANQIGGMRVEYFRQPTNRKLDNFNTCIELARGTWVHMLHDDDWVLPGFYRSLGSALQRQSSTIGAACCGYANTDVAGNRIFESESIRPTAGVIENWITRIGVGNLLNPPAIVIRRNVYEQLGGFCTPLFYTGDWEMCRRVASFYDWWYEPGMLACYRQHTKNNTSPGMASGAFIADMRLSIHVAQTYLPISHRAEITAAAKRNCALYAIDRSIPFIQCGNSTATAAILSEALKTCRTEEILNLIRQLAAMPYAAHCKDLMLQIVGSVR